ncbi:MAG: YggU family protein [Chromatiaceae bacterium]|nr:YggU family protein [Gammaproteobacteria bacterium]MCP5427389.1 YggU family protein [Chromatiaceae bacterium]MCB1860450.1 YggU family protein [Gammaproteobacteria bacterium]MCB1871202.1 YggU family protein [Gammaproteobacteria bacterium]MCB1879661.1 YggU family protein [Gammaproteobacteria bacterium]
MKPSQLSWYRWEHEDLLLYLQIQPRASQDEFVAPHGDHYKVRITAPPVEGKANAHLLRFLAKSFGVHRSSVSLLSGASSRHKGVRIQNPRKMPVPAVQA